MRKLVASAIACCMCLVIMYAFHLRSEYVKTALKETVLRNAIANSPGAEGFLSTSLKPSLRLPFPVPDERRRAGWRPDTVIEPFAETDPPFPVPPKGDRKRQAIVTMVSDEHSAAKALALVQTLRDVQTQVNIVVMVMKGGEKWTSWHSNQSDSEAIRSIVTEDFYNAFLRLSVRLRLTEQMPWNSLLDQIPGGSSTNWGMSFHRFRMFELVEYENVLWMDADTVVLENVDYLLDYPEYTGAFTNACCNLYANKKPSGGLYTVKPSLSRLQQIIDLSKNESPLRHPELPSWYMSDLDMVKVLFFNISTVMRENEDPNLMWPQRIGGRTGTNWNMLDITYDVLTGECNCAKERYTNATIRTAHYTCFPIGLRKPFDHPAMDPRNPLSYIDENSTYINRVPPCILRWFAFAYDALYRALQKPTEDIVWESDDVLPQVTPVMSVEY